MRVFPVMRAVWMAARLSLTACAAPPTAADCACGADQICVVGAEATCLDLPASCDPGVLDCAADASDDCKSEICGGLPSTWTLACETDGPTWAACG